MNAEKVQKMLGMAQERCTLNPHLAYDGCSHCAAIRWLMENSEELAAVYIESERKLKIAAEALGPFSACMEYIDASEDDDEWAKFRLIIKDYRMAQKALAEIGGE